MISHALLDAMQRINGLLQAGDFRTARQQLEAVVDGHPDYAEARRLLAGAKLALGDAEGAEQVLRAAAALDPVWPPTLTMLGELLLNDGRQTEAEQFLLRAATGTPADPRANTSAVATTRAVTRWRWQWPRRSAPQATPRRSWPRNT